MKSHGWKMCRVSKYTFSLLEVILALLILSGTVSVLLTDQTKNVRRSVATAEDRRALQLLHNKMNELILQTEEAFEGEFEGEIGYRWSLEQAEENLVELSDAGSIQVWTLSVWTPSNKEHQLKRWQP